MKIYIETIGCPKNEADSQVLKQLLSVQDTIVSEAEESDVIIVNTCGFILDAQKESIDTLLDYSIHWKDRGIGSPPRKIIAWGCLIQRYFSELRKAIPELDGWAGVVSVEKLAIEIRRFLSSDTTESFVFWNSQPDPIYSCGQQYCEIPPHYSYVKIGDGCNGNCSFCSIPSFKGEHQSRPLPQIVEEVESLVRKGKKEIILVDQDTTQYSYQRKTLQDLLFRLDRIDADFWIRVMYMHPDHLNLELIDAIKEGKKILPYFEIPIQHASDEILRDMNRVKSADQLKSLIRTIREKIPHAAIRTSVIVGYPGEKPKAFEELLQFITQAQFDRLGVFIFSLEEGAPIYRSLKEKIPVRIARKRMDKVMSLQSKISLQKNQQFIGQTLQVLVDSEFAPHFGRCYRDAPEIDGEIDLRSEVHLITGEFYQCRITAASEHDLEGVVL